MNVLDQMAWALWGLDYLKKADTANNEEFNDLLNELRGPQHVRSESWYNSCKEIIPALHGASDSFAGNVCIPNEKFASPDAFEQALNQFQALVTKMADDLDQESQKYKTTHNLNGPPLLVIATRRQVGKVSAAINYVQSRKPHALASNSVEADIELIVGLARRFHEAVLSLKKHPHNGVVFTVNNEWDCQYIFRSILAAYIADIRDEEWNPSFAGSSARCEFFLKSLKIMIELKFVRQATDAKKIKTEFATDLLDYGKNPQVNHVILLVYDPNSVLQNAVALEEDFSRPTSDLSRVDVVISPQRR